MHRLKLLKRKLLHTLHAGDLDPEFAMQAELLQNVPWDTSPQEASFTVIDCEMTGLQAESDDLLAIGAVKIRGRRLYPGDSFYQVIRPSTAEPLAPDNVLIHRLGDDQVQAGHPLAETLHAFISFISTDTLIAHCAQLDLAFLDKAMRHHAGIPLQNPVIDTAKLYRWHRRREEPHLATEQESIALDTLRSSLALPDYPAHHALGDAMTTACLFLKLQPHLDRAGHHRLRDLYKLAGA